MDKFEKLVLFCLKSIENERTAYAVLHLLNGKKSSQTIQDAHLFHLKQCFHILPHLTREDFKQILQQLVAAQYIIHSGEGNYQLTDKGNQQLMSSEAVLPQYLNGWTFHRIDTIYWERLALMVQVISNLMAHNHRYIPVQTSENHHHWLKKFIQRNGMNRHSISLKVFLELQCILTNKEIDPLVLILRLTGSERIGLTAQQTAEYLQITPYHYQLQFKNVIHLLITDINRHPTTYPILRQLLDEEEKSEWSQLTQSTKKTAHFLKMGYAVEEIMQIRKLKQGTIEDHIVELAIVDPSFNIDVYVPQDVQRDIINTATTGIKQLKYIRQSIPHASYFQIRLTLAKHKSAVSV